MSQEKKFKVGDAVVDPGSLYDHRSKPKHGIVHSVARRWLKVNFNGYVSDSERWDAFTGKLDSEYTRQHLLTVAEFEELEAACAARAKLSAVGVTVDERVSGHLHVIEVWAALEPLVTARTAAAEQDPQAP